MEQKKEKGLRIRSCLTGAIWLALVFSTVISALLFAFLNHFFNLPGSIPMLGWLLIFNTLIAGLITSFINAKLLEPITRLSKAMKDFTYFILFHCTSPDSFLFHTYTIQSQSQFNLNKIYFS